MQITVELTYAELDVLLIAVNHALTEDCVPIDSDDDNLNSAQAKLKDALAEIEYRQKVLSKLSDILDHCSKD